MKFLTLALTLASFQSLAQVETIYSKKVTCQELKDFIQSRGVAHVIQKRFLGTKQDLVVYHAATCSTGQHVVQAEFKTDDERYCEAGQYCQTAYVYSSSSYVLTGL